MRHFYLSAVLLLVTFTAYSQIVDIPDANFKNALVNTSCVTGPYGLSDGGTTLGDADTNNDGEIQVSEAAAVEGLHIPNQNIASMVGIQAFTNLYYLNCSHNNLASLTFTTSPWLIDLNCSHNQLTSLNTSFYLNGDMMYEMNFDCRYNQLTTLNIPAGQRYWVYCGFNPLTNITQSDGEWYDWIEYLSVENNNFVHFNPDAGYSQLSLKNCPMMTSAEVGGDVVMVENNPALLTLNVWSGGMHEIHNNPLLQSIDYKDGYAPIATGDLYDPDYNVTNNPSLQFVCVDDLGNWHDEGGNIFFNHERYDVTVSPGVAITYYCDYIPGGGFNTITGTLHYNCDGVNMALTQEDAEVNLVNTSGTATVNPTGDGSFTFYTLGTGTITPSFGNSYFMISPPNFPYSFTGTGNTQNVNFCLTPNGVHPDVKITIIPTTPAVPGFDADYKMVCTNKGTETLDGSISVSFDDDLTDFISASPIVETQSVGTLTWNFAGLAPFETREIDFTMNVNTPLETPAVNSGDVLDFSAVVTPTLTDQTPSDNTNILAQTVVNSLDPNDKAVSRATIGLPQLGDYLYYTVRFQNNGTFQAQNVVIRDLIDSKLNFSSAEIVASSHSCRTQMTPQTNSTPGNKLEFFFEGINLPAEQDNEPASHGFVTYRIKTNTNLALNDVISNTAGIYFDYNAPIITNTVTTTVSALGTGETNVLGFSLSPNPANHTFVITLDNVIDVTSIAVYNALGQLVQSIKPAFENGQMRADVSFLTQGSYFIRIVTGKGIATRKLVKL